MTEHAPDRIWSGIDIPKTIAGVLAAVSAAVIGSFLGVAGTLAGAAVASLIGSVGTEIYHRFINRGRKKIEGTFLAPAAVGTPPVEAAVHESPSEPPKPRKIRWARVMMVAGALFVLAMGTLTMAEVISGRSVADATQGGNHGSTTLGGLVSGKSDSPKSTPAPAESSAPAETSRPDSTPSPAPTGQDTTGPSVAPTSEAPTTQAPPTEAPAGTGDTSGGGSVNDLNPNPNGTE